MGTLETSIAPPSIPASTDPSLEQSRLDRLSRSSALVLAAQLLLVLAVAILVYSRFGIDDLLFRDEAIYAYGGQQLVEGVPPYVSIIDPKTPMATFLSGAAVAVGRTIGADDLHAIRVAFFVISCLTLVAVFIAAALLTESSVAGLVGAASFLSFRGFAIDALGGPNAKTPGILFAVLATALLLRRRWFMGGIAASLATLVWQPLVIYVAVAIAFAWFSSEGSDRGRHSLAALAGAVIPGAAAVLYFIVVGAFTELFQTAFVLPLFGTERPDQGGFPDHVRHIFEAVARGYGWSSVFFWAGIGSVLVLAGSRIWKARSGYGVLGRDPLIVVVAIPLLFFIAFSLFDFQGYPDAYPFLPLAAFGIACAVAFGLKLMEGRGLRTAALAIAGAGTLGVVVLTWAWYGQARPDAEARGLIAQRESATVADALLGPDGSFWALGDPSLLVLMQRRNPSPEIYMAAGVDAWVIQRKPGGFDGWTAEIDAADPDMVVLDHWHGADAARMRKWLRSQFERIRIGPSGAFVTPELSEEAKRPSGALLLR